MHWLKCTVANTSTGYTWLKTITGSCNKHMV